MPEGTPITTNVAVKDIKTWYDSKGGGYVSEVIFEDGVSLKLLHQSPKMQLHLWRLMKQLKRYTILKEHFTDITTTLAVIPCLDIFHCDIGRDRCAFGHRKINTLMK